MEKVENHRYIRRFWGYPDLHRFRGGGATPVNFVVGRWGDEIPRGSGVTPDLVEIRVPPESTNVSRFGVIWGVWKSENCEFRRVFTGFRDFPHGQKGADSTTLSRKKGCSEIASLRRFENLGG